MKFRLTAPTLLLASLCGAVLMSAPLVTAPAAHAACTAGQTYDPSTGVCWSQASPNQSITGTGGVCLPGRLGLCMAGVANSQMPGANLQTQVPAGPNRTWP